MELLGIRPDFMSSRTASGMYGESSEPVPHIDGTGPPFRGSRGDRSRGYLRARSAVAEILRTAATGAKGLRQTIPRAAAKQAGMKVRTADGALTSPANRRITRALARAVLKMP